MGAEKISPTGQITFLGIAWGMSREMSEMRLSLRRAFQDARKELQALNELLLALDAEAMGHERNSRTVENLKQRARWLQALSIAHSAAAPDSRRVLRAPTTKPRKIPHKQYRDRRCGNKPERGRG